MSNEATKEAARWLRDRAESYGRDVHALRDAGDTPAAAAYGTIRDELRLCADQIDGTEQHEDL
jgi:hypothetical protein